MTVCLLVQVDMYLYVNYLRNFWRLMGRRRRFRFSNSGKGFSINNFVQELDMILFDDGQEAIESFGTGSKSLPSIPGEGPRRFFPAIERVAAPPASQASKHYS